MLHMRPILEYVSTVWAPHTKTNTDKLESIQRQAASFTFIRYI